MPLVAFALLIAISKSAGAECLFAHDGDCKTVASHFFSIKGLDERPDSVNQQVGVFAAQPFINP